MGLSTPGTGRRTVWSPQPEPSCREAGQGGAGPLPAARPHCWVGTESGQSGNLRFRRSSGGGLPGPRPHTSKLSTLMGERGSRISASQLPLAARARAVPDTASGGAGHLPRRRGPAHAAARPHSAPRAPGPAGLGNPTAALEPPAPAGGSARAHRAWSSAPRGLGAVGRPARPPGQRGADGVPAPRSDSRRPVPPPRAPSGLGRERNGAATTGPPGLSTLWGLREGEAVPDNYGRGQPAPMTAGGLAPHTPVPLTLPARHRLRPRAASAPTSPSGRGWRRAPALAPPRPRAPAPAPARRRRRRRPPPPLTPVSSCGFFVFFVFFIVSSVCLASHFSFFSLLLSLCPPPLVDSPQGKRSGGARSLPCWTRELQLRGGEGVPYRRRLPQLPPILAGATIPAYSGGPPHPPPPAPRGHPAAPDARPRGRGGGWGMGGSAPRPRPRPAQLTQRAAMRCPITPRRNNSGRSFAALACGAPRSRYPRSRGPPGPRGW